MARAKDRVALVLTLLTLAVYFGFVFLLAFRKDVFAIRITANVPAGIPIGVGVIVASCAFTGVYVWWANGRYDAMVRTLQRRARELARSHRAGG